MKRLVFAILGFIAGACAPMDADRPKTPDEIANEQEQLGAEQSKKGKYYDSVRSGTRNTRASSSVARRARPRRVQNR
jgi:hypothetical protein